MADRFCGKCRTRLPDAASYCGTCGRRYGAGWWFALAGVVVAVGAAIGQGVTGEVGKNLHDWCYARFWGGPRAQVATPAEPVERPPAVPAGPPRPDAKPIPEPAVAGASNPAPAPVVAPVPAPVVAPAPVTISGPVTVSGPVTLMQAPRVVAPETATPLPKVAPTAGDGAVIAAETRPPRGAAPVAPDPLARLRRQGDVYTGEGIDLAAAGERLVGGRVRFRGSVERLSHVNAADRWTWLVSADGRARVRVAWDRCPAGLRDEFMFAKRPLGMVLTLTGVVESYDEGTLELKVERWMGER